MIHRSWRLARVALQLIAEETAGETMRAQARADQEARAREDAAYDALKAAHGAR